MRNIIGKLRIVEGDATDPQKTTPNEIVIIPHVCNNRNRWGAGFVKALSVKDKTPEICYRSMFNPIPAPNNDRNMLGRVSFATLGSASYYEHGTEIKKCSSHIYVANMIAQDGTGRDDEPEIPLRYNSLVVCMSKVREWIISRQSKSSNSYVIHCPKFGSELSKGKWEFILELIREQWLEHGIDVVVYEFKE